MDENHEVPLPPASQTDRDSVQNEAESILDHGTRTPVSFPHEFDYFNNLDYKAGASDDLLTEATRTLSNRNVSLFHLLPIIDAEQTNLQALEMEYNNLKPEWKDQKFLVSEANNYFDQNTTAEQVDISIEKTPEGKTKTSVGKSRNNDFRTFHRESFDDEYNEAYKFEELLENFDTIKQTLIQIASNDNSLISPEQKTLLAHYLDTKIQRYEDKREQEKAPTEKQNLAKTARILESLQNQVLEYQNVGTIHKKEPYKARVRTHRPSNRKLTGGPRNRKAGVNIRGIIKKH